MDGPTLKGARADYPGGNAVGTVPRVLKVAAAITAAALAIGACGLQGVATVRSEEGHGHAESPESEVTPSWLDRVATRRTPAIGGFVIRVEIAADQSYREARGTHWKDAAIRAVMASSDLMEQVDVNLDVVAVRPWESDPAPLPEMLIQATAQENRRDAVLVAFTSHESLTYPMYDGWTAASELAMVLKVTDSNEWAVSALVAHEMGHLFGAHHYEGGHICDGGCVMDAVGYAHGDRWCDHHREAIAATLGNLAS